MDKIASGASARPLSSGLLATGPLSIGPSSSGPLVNGSASSGLNEFAGDVLSRAASVGRPYAPRTGFARNGSSSANLNTSLVNRPSPGVRIVDDLDKLVGGASSASSLLRKVAAADSSSSNGIGATGIKMPTGLGERLLSRASVVLNVVTGSRDFLGQFSAEYDQGSRFYPRTTLRAAFGVGQSMLTAQSATVAYGAGAAAAGLVAGAVGVAGATAAVATVGTGVLAAAAVGYAVGTGVNYARDQLYRVLPNI